MYTAARLDDLYGTLDCQTRQLHALIAELRLKVELQRARIEDLTEELQQQVRWIDDLKAQLRSRSLHSLVA